MPAVADAEQQQIQGLIDKFAADVCGGTDLAEAGGIAAATGVAAISLGMRRAARR